MGALEQVTINGHLVFRDEGYPHRWLDAFGPKVVKMELKSPLALQAANSLAAYKTTLVNASTIAETPDIAGGAILITTAAVEHDGVNLHTISEPFTFQFKYPTYFGIKFQTNDADQSVLWAGFGIADDEWHGGLPADLVAFTSPDEFTSANFSVQKNAAATTLEAVAVLADNVDCTLEMYYGGADDPHFYVYTNGVLAGSIAYSNDNVPSDGEELALTLEFITGEGNAATCTIYWMRAIQIQQE